MNRFTKILFIILIFISMSGLGTAAEIFVQPGGSIQAAVNNSSSGDTITVKSGTYTENIKITKANLIIRSESGNPDNTILKYKTAASNVLLLQANNVTVTGFKIIGASRSTYAGINLSSCSNCVIDNNKLVNNSRGVYLLRASGNTVTDNAASNSLEYGIALQGSTGNTISGNTISGNQRGIYFGTSDNNKLLNNIVKGNSVYGFFICGLSDGNSIYNNYFNDTNMTIRNGVGNSYYTSKTSGTNIVGGAYIGGNFWGKPDGTGFSNTAADTDGDGISDSAYNNITSSIYSDKLPLVISSSGSKSLAANFTTNVTSGNVPLNVAFTDSSTGSPTSWKWSFGDGTSNSTVQNPTHTYSTAGNYTVMLTVANSAGNNTTTKSNYIKVTANNTTSKPIANFTTNVTSGTVPLMVAFTDKSTNNPTSWKWSFGDGTANSTVQNPTHNYSTAGNYTVILTVTNSAGSNATTKSNYIKVTANNTVSKPVANFTTNVTSGTVPLMVAFTDKSTGSPTTWNWSFGDGTTNSTLQNPVHNYSNAGNYTVILKVTNSAGSNTTTKTSYIKVTANNTTTALKPVVSFWGSRTSGTAPLTITFTDASTNTPTSWNWSFGDGTYSTVQKPKHIYSKAGNYSVKLTASNAAGSGTLTRSNYIKVT